jgi:hypothetical protein
MVVVSLLAMELARQMTDEGFIDRMRKRTDSIVEASPVLNTEADPDPDLGRVEVDLVPGKEAVFREGIVVVAVQVVMAGTIEPGREVVRLSREVDLKEGVVGLSREADLREGVVRVVILEKVVVLGREADPAPGWVELEPWKSLLG